MSVPEFEGLRLVTKECSAPLTTAEEATPPCVQLIYMSSSFEKEGETEGLVPGLNGVARRVIGARLPMPDTE